MGADGKLTLNDGATGAVASFLTGFSSDLCYVIDDFEGYTETGVGLDGSHKDETAFKGLRSKWYSDYYSGNNYKAQKKLFPGNCNLFTAQVHRYYLFITIY